MWKRPNIKSWPPNPTRLKRAGACFCFYCGVDSKPLILFFLATLGFAVLGSVCIFLWSLASGHWKHSERPKYKILEAESNE